MTSRELVKATLEFKNTNGRVPRQLWTLPWAFMNEKEALDRIVNKFEWDFSNPVTIYEKVSPAKKGNPDIVGISTDDWGCVFTSIQAGVVGEVKTPLIDPDDYDWKDTSRVHIPEELLTFNVDKVNESCKASDKFMMASVTPRPFEQMQFIRGTENLYIDIATENEEMLKFLARMHDFYCRLLERWAKTEVDGLSFMDDWGTQRSLLISPKAWREIFKPLYKDYIDIAHSYGKKIFMHSDGYTLDIIPDLIELGLDALNTQIFCMNMEDLARFKGKITFWGEICRQKILPFGTTDDVKNAVESVYNTLWDNGGCIAQCEFGAGANPKNVEAVYDNWLNIHPFK